MCTNRWSVSYCWWNKFKNITQQSIKIHFAVPPRLFREERNVGQPNKEKTWIKNVKELAILEFDHSTNPFGRFFWHTDGCRVNINDCQYQGETSALILPGLTIRSGPRPQPAQHFKHVRTRHQNLETFPNPVELIRAGASTLKGPKAKNIYLLKDRGYAFPDYSHMNLNLKTSWANVSSSVALIWCSNVFPTERRT